MRLPDAEIDYHVEPEGRKNWGNVSCSRGCQRINQDIVQNTHTYCSRDRYLAARDMRGLSVDRRKLRLEVAQHGDQGLFIRISLESNNLHPHTLTLM